MPLDIWVWIGVAAASLAAVWLVLRDERIHTEYQGSDHPLQRPCWKTVDRLYDWEQDGL